MSSYKEGQVHQVMEALEEAKWTAEDLTKFGQSGENLVNIRAVLRGTHQITPIDHMIDLGAPARLPFDGAVLEVHRGSGVARLEQHGDDLHLNEKRISLFLSEEQIRGTIVGHNLRQKLEARGGNLPAVVLDYLEDHPQLWPDSWKKDAQGKTVYVFFWDDIFRDPSDGNLCVRYGYWSDGRVVSDYLWLDNDWYGNYPAASVASSPKA